MYSFYQPLGFIASSDVTILSPLFEMNSYIALFIVSILSMDKYKWSYGRQIRLNDSQKLRIKLPANIDGLPDWQFMEYYIKSMPYSSNLKDIVKPNKGLSEAELVAKYERGAIDLKKPLKAMLKKPSNSSVLKKKNK